ncbi:MAG: glycosyltransferase family 87 protein [Candidatus Peribacteraceae bacterium]|jgi:hypothetical protein|nr:glycosyltransferase family 87 protein [Candidatus Peribacteraceae bacterium]
MVHAFSLLAKGVWQVDNSAMKHHLFIALTLAIAFLAILTTYFPYVQFSNDIDVFEKIAGSVGTSEYPPLASSLFYALSLPGFSFETAWLIFLGLMMIGAALYAYRFCKTEDASILIIATFVSIYLIGVHYSVARFDIVVMLLIFMSWRASLNDRWKDSGFFLILASALKLTPIVLLPLLYILAPKNAQKRLSYGVFVGIVVSVLIPIFTLGISQSTENVKYMLKYHSERGVGIDSTWSGIHMLAKNLNGEKVETALHHVAHHNAELGNSVTFASTIILILGLLAIYYFAWKKRSEKSAVWIPLTMMWIVFASPILSPQFVMWFYPILIIIVIDTLRNRQTSIFTLGLIISLVLMGVARQWLGPLYYDKLLAQEGLKFTLILNLRNLMILVGGVLLVFDGNKRREAF